MTEAIKKFQYEDGTHMPLSNFYPSPIEHEGRTYPTVEHFFQAFKSADDEGHERVRLCATPGDAKRMGRKIRMRADWDDVRVGIMQYALMLKFAPGTPLAEWLISTGDAHLEEGNHWGDTFWGTTYGRGNNWLGVLLMQRRDILQGLT